MRDEPEATLNDLKGIHTLFFLYIGFSIKTKIILVVFRIEEILQKSYRK